MLNKFIDSLKEEDFSKNITTNKRRFRQIKTIVTSIFILAGIQGVDSSNVLAFDVIPLEAVSTSVTDSQYGGLGDYVDIFQVNVEESPGLDSMTKLVGFTVSFTPVGSPPAPPNPQIFSAAPPLGWELTETGQVPNYFCGGGPPFGKPYCVTISIPTLTFQAITLMTGIFPGNSLGGFRVAYNTGCGIYCGGLRQSVIAVSSAPVPEPVTILGSAIALGFGITLKRKHSKTDRNKT